MRRGTIKVCNLWLSLGIGSHGNIGAPREHTRKPLARESPKMGANYRIFRISAAGTLHTYTHTHTYEHTHTQLRPTQGVHRVFRKTSSRILAYARKRARAHTSTVVDLSPREFVIAARLTKSFLKKKKKRNIIRRNINIKCKKGKPRRRW